MSTALPIRTLGRLPLRLGGNLLCRQPNTSAVPLQELGGKSALIVFEDADIDKAVEWAMVRFLGSCLVGLWYPTSMLRCCSYGG
jgi:hypothetical protein